MATTTRQQLFKTIGLAGALVLALVPVAGCAGGRAGSQTTETVTVTASAEETPSITEAAEATDGTDGSSETFFYSDGIDENGHWAGVTATDYVELPNYKALPIPAEEAEITDAEVETQVESNLANYTSTEQVTDRAIVDGDTVNIDYVGSVDGVEFEGGSTDGAGTDVTIGETSYIDDFLEQLIGHSAGDSFDINVTFPDDYSNTEVAGKDAVFATTVNYIVETIEPEVTDAWVAENLAEDYGWTTVEEMNEGVRADLRHTAIQSYIYTYLTTEVTVSEIPQAVLEHGQKLMVDYYQSYADSYGVSLDEFLVDYVGVESLDALLEQTAGDNETAAIYTLVIQAIAEDAPITVDEADLAAFFMDSYGSEDYSEYETNYGLPYLKQTVLGEKVMDYLYDHAVVEGDK
ncbi:MAG: FKBP-type peptidyl-prolyl cis-trans isomerase [Bifidobacteriaceae bacterium]|jgi:trigger factor|nr:FKBP-type peptidyl-prolyl cis-trans isomerase [Bifidobacteriaceae bacterium]